MCTSALFQRVQFMFCIVAIVCANVLLIAGGWYYVFLHASTPAPIAPPTTAPNGPARQSPAMMPARAPKAILAPFGGVEGSDGVPYNARVETD